MGLTAAVSQALCGRQARVSVGIVRRKFAVCGANVPERWSAV